MESLGLQSGGLGKALGGSAGGSREHDALFFATQDFHQPSYECGLACSRAAGDHQNLGEESSLERHPLARCELDTGKGLVPIQSFLDVDAQRQLALSRQVPQRSGDVALGTFQSAEIDGDIGAWARRALPHLPALQIDDHNLVLGYQLFHCLLDPCRRDVAVRHLEQLLGRVQ